MKRLSIIFVLILQGYVHAQSYKDSLYNVIQQNSEPDSVLYQVHTDLAHHLEFEDLNTSLSHYDEAMAIANRMKRFDLANLSKRSKVIANFRNSQWESGRKLAIELVNDDIKRGDSSNLDKYYQNIAVSYKKQTIYDSAIKYNDIAIAIAKSQGDTSNLISILNNQGNVLSDLGNFLKAIEQYHQAQYLAELYGDSNQLAKAIMALGIMHDNMGDYDQGLAHFKRCLEINEAIGSVQGVGLAYQNISAAYGLKDDYKNAIEYAQLSYEYGQKVNDPFVQGDALGNIATNLNDLERYDEALEYIERSMAISIELNDPIGLAYSYNTRATTHFHKNELNKALEDVQMAIRYADESGMISVMGSAYENMFEIQKQLGNHEEALKALERSIEITDSIRNKENERALIQQEFKYTYEKAAIADSIRSSQKQAVIQAQLKQEQTQRYGLYLGLGVLLVFGGFTYNRFKKSQHQKKIIEQQKAEVEKAHDEVDRFKTEFFTNISHEFRTPLTVILGATEDMKGMAETKEAIVRNSKRLLKLINQILDLSKVESGKVKITNKNIDIIRFTQYLLDSMRSLSDSKKIDVQYLTDRGELAMMLDSEKFQDIFTNLFNNAVKFTPEGGIIEIKVTLNQNLFELRVHDNGSGIPEDQLPKVFERFFQVENQEHEKIGSGVGLALSRELVKAMGGNISVQNGSLGGAEFKVILPYLPANGPVESFESIRKSEPKEKIIQKDQTQDKKDEDLPLVLVVEDEADIRNLMEKSLSDDYRVVLANDGAEGIDLAMEHIPDLIVSDVMMPKKDGFQLTDTLKNDKITSHIPVILLTAKTDYESRIAGLRRGADVYLPKPFAREELLLHLSNLLNLRSKIQAYFQGHSQEASPEAQEDSFIINVKSHLEKHLDDEQFGIEDLCKAEAMSRMQLHRKLKALTDQSTSDFIQKYKVNRGKEMLTEGKMNISEVAYATGFSDPSYFSRIFKKHFDLSPTEFLENQS